EVHSDPRAGLHGVPRGLRRHDPADHRAVQQDVPRRRSGARAGSRGPFEGRAEARPQAGRLALGAERMPRFTLGDLAGRVGGRVQGDGAVAVEGLKPLDEAGPRDLALLALPRYRAAAAASAAAAILTSEALAPPGRAALLVGDPYTALAAL